VVNKCIPLGDTTKKTHGCRNFWAGGGGGTILTPATDIAGQMKMNTAEKKIKSCERSQ
jgi:hypothetical protein